MASYLQFQSDKGLWRYRRPIPPECQSALGGKKVILHSLGTRSEPEAKRLAVPLIDRVFFKWAVSRHLAADNPARKIIVEKDIDDEDDEKARLPYSLDDPKKIFAAPLYRGCRSDHRVHEEGTVRGTLPVEIRDVLCDQVLAHLVESGIAKQRYQPAVA